MNTRNLKEVFSHYIEKFEWLNKKDGADESYKWIAIKDFQSVFDLDVADDDFVEMLKKAKKATVNLIDSSQQPFGALCAYAEEDCNAVRRMLKDLLSDDGGDLAQRQRNIDIFLVRAEELRQKYYPESHMFINSQHSAMAYMWFYNPDKYYYYKATEARYLADCVEVYDDWGTYATFKLDVFHRFCDEIVRHMQNDEALMETHNSRFVGNKEAMFADKSLHVLIVDIIFCSKRYGLYDGIAIKDSSAPAKRLYQERKAKAAELQSNVETAQKRKSMLAEAEKIFMDMLSNGGEIYHKVFGKAALVEISNGYCTLLFERKNEQKKFRYLSALADGFIKIENPSFESQLKIYRDVMKSESSIEKQLEIAIKALAPYEEYLD